MRGCGSAKRASLVTRRGRPARPPPRPRPRRPRPAPPRRRRAPPPPAPPPHSKPPPGRAPPSPPAPRPPRLQAPAGCGRWFPSDPAAPTALYMLGAMLGDRGGWSGAARWFGELIARSPADLRASVARFRLAAQAVRDGGRDSAAALFQAEVTAAGPQRTTARFWLGKLTLLAHDTAGARATWLALVREDSIGYYGLRARREIDLPPLRIAAAPLPGPSPTVATSLGRIDTLLLARLDTAPPAEVRALLGRAAQQDVDALLAWSDGLAARGFGPAAVRLGWQAALKSPNDSRVLRVIFPWPNRRAVEAEAAEFGIDPLLLVAIVRDRKSTRLNSSHLVIS